MSFRMYVKIPPNDCNEVKAELHTAMTANSAYYLDWNEFAPTIGDLAAYGYTPSEFSTGYIQYGRQDGGNEAGFWEGSRRDRSCPGESGKGRYTLQMTVGTLVWRNDSELQSWRDSLGI